MTTNELGNFEVWKVTQMYHRAGQETRREEEMMRVRNEAENM